MKKLPNTNRTYRDVSELEEDIVKICNTDDEITNKVKRNKVKIVGCVIGVGKDKDKNIVARNVAMRK